MTKDEESAKVGRLTVEHSEVRRHIVLLENELREIGRALEPLPVFLRRADPNKVLEILGSVDFAKLKATAEKLAKAEAQRQKTRSANGELMFR